MESKIKVLQPKYGNHMSYRTYLRIVDLPADEAAQITSVWEFLELVFYWGQNDFQPKDSPSVSVGDIAIVGDKYYVCDSLGWSEVEADA